MRVLVTGAAGFIGSALCRALLAQGYAVTGLDALTYAANPASLHGLDRTGPFRLLIADLRDAEAVSRAIAQAEPRIVFHLAAETHVDRSIDTPGDFVSTNVTGTLNLLEALRGHHRALPADAAHAFRLIHVSTDEVFGSLGADGSFTEQSAYAPQSPYAASKAGADHLVRAWHATYGLPAIITNCSNNFGPRQFPEKLIPLMVLRALAGQSMPVYGTGRNVRDWLYVEDHAEALIAIASRGEVGATYLIGGGAERTNLDIVRRIAARLDQHRPGAAPHARLIAFVEDRPGHDFRYSIDASHLRRALGWQPRHDFETALTDTVDWYLANEAWWKPLVETRYSGERLGLGG